MSNGINGLNYTQSLWWVSKKNSEQNNAQEEQPAAEVQSDSEIQQSLIAPERVLDILTDMFKFNSSDVNIEKNKPVTNNGNLQNVSTYERDGYKITLTDELPRSGEVSGFFDQVNGQFVTDLPEDEFDPKATLTIKTPDGDIHEIDILCDATTRSFYAQCMKTLFNNVTYLPDNVLDIMSDELDFINITSNAFEGGSTLAYVNIGLNGIFIPTNSSSNFSQKTLVHELGHALDNNGTTLKETYSMNYEDFYSFKQELIDLCPELKNNYALSNVQEFWAEYFCQKNLGSSMYFSKIYDAVENARDKEGYDSVKSMLNEFTTEMDEKMDNVLSYDKDARKDSSTMREFFKEITSNKRHNYENEEEYFIPISEDNIQAIADKLTDRSIIDDFNAIVNDGFIDSMQTINKFLAEYQKDPAFCKDMAYQKFHDYQKAVYNIEESVRKMNEHPDKFDPAELKAWNDKAQSHLKALEETEKMLDSFFEKCDKVIDSLHDDYFLAQNDTKPVNNSEETKKPNSSQSIDKSETTSQTEALQKPVENQQQTPSKPVQEIQQQVSNKQEAQKPQNQPVPESPKEEETVQERPKPADPVQPDIQKPQEAPADTVEPDVTDTPETTTPAAPSQPEKQPDVTDSKEPEKAEELEQPVESKPLNPQTNPDRTPLPENNTNPPVSNPQPTVPENRPFVPNPVTPSNNDINDIPDTQPETPDVTPDKTPDVTPDFPTSELPELPDTPDITDGELAAMPDVTVDSGHIAPEFEIETNRGPNEEITLETKPKEMTDEEKAAFEQALKDKYGEDKNYDISYNADGSVDWKVSDSGSSITGENQSSNQTPAEPAEPQTPAPESSKPGTEPLPEPSIAPEIPDISDDLPAPGNTDSKDNNAQDNNIPGSQEIEAPPIAPETPNIADDLPAPAPADTTTPGNTTTSDSDNADKDTAEDAAPGSQEIEAPSLAQEPSKPSGFTPITVDESRKPQNQTPTYAGVGINVGDYTNSNGTIDTDRLTQDWADNGGEVFTYDNQSDINNVWNAAVSAEQSGNWGGFWDGLGSGSSMGSTGSDPFADISGDFNVFEVGGGGGGNNPFAIQLPTGSSSGKIHKFQFEEMKFDINK